MKNMKKKNNITIERPQRNPIQCAREILNYSSIERSDRFDKPGSFNPEKLVEKLHVTSPTLEAMLRKIEELDKKDFLVRNKLYKHYIFTDIKRGYGAKIIASAMVAAGYIPVIKAKGTRIVIDSEKIDIKSDSKFAILSSTSLWNATTSLNSTKEILTAFNKRPDNIFGKDIRFIVLDSSFKEGVDLYDVKYCHIFESQLDNSSLVQAIGRGTRFCGQRGLRFNGGWDLNVFNYHSISKPVGFFKGIANKVLFRKQKSIVRSLQERDPNIIKKNSTEAFLTELMINNAVDKKLNSNINNLNTKSNVEFILIAATVAAIVTTGLIYNKNKK
jgi:hypothetical protein